MLKVRYSVVGEAELGRLVSPVFMSWGVVQHWWHRVVSLGIDLHVAVCVCVCVWGRGLGAPCVSLTGAALGGSLCGLVYVLQRVTLYQGCSAGADPAGGHMPHSC